MYKNYFTREQLEEQLKDKVSSVELNQIVSAYEMAENAHKDHYLSDGTHYFTHISRVCKIIVDELEIFDKDVIIAALLHDVHKTTDEIDCDIIEYNFGSFATYLIKNLKTNYKFLDINPHLIDFKETSTRNGPGDEVYIIRLAEHLDKFRRISFNPVYNPIQYIQTATEVYFPMAERSENPAVQYLLREIKKERNKILD